MIIASVCILEIQVAKAVLANLKTVADLQAYAGAAKQMLGEILVKMSDEELAKAARAFLLRRPDCES